MRQPLKRSYHKDLEKCPVVKGRYRSLHIGSARSPLAVNGEFVIFITQQSRKTYLSSIRISMKTLCLPQLKCERCGHTWIPRGTVVTVCAKCKSPYWDVPKKARSAAVSPSAGR